jgi:hypothetical protein
MALTTPHRKKQTGYEKSHRSSDLDVLHPTLFETSLKTLNFFTKVPLHVSAYMAMPDRTSVTFESRQSFSVNVLLEPREAPVLKIRSYVMVLTLVSVSRASVTLYNSERVTARRVETVA